MSSGQTIFRNAGSKRQFTSILNDTLQDGMLSPEAGWVLVLVLSLPPDWAVHLDWISKRRQMGRDRTRAAIRELVKHKYCKRRRTRGPGGRLGPYEFIFTDLPGCFGDEPPPEIQALVKSQQKRASAPRPEIQALVKSQQTRASAPRPDLPAPENQSPTKDLVNHKDGNGHEQRDHLGDRGGDPIPFGEMIDGDPMPSERKTAPEILAEGRRLAASAKTPPRKKPLCSSSGRVAIRNLLLDPDEIEARYRAWVEDRTGPPIADPTAYMVRMAQQERADRDEITVEQVMAITTGDHGARAEALAAAVGAVDEPLAERRKRGSAPRTNGAALMAALNKSRLQ